MKKFIFSGIFAIYFCTAAFAGDSITNETSPLKVFNAVFKNSENAVWAYGKEYSDVSFNMDGIQMKARFDAEGNLLQTIRYYKENLLPAFVMLRIKKHYKGYEIFGVTELSTPDQLCYTFSLRNEKNMYIVVADGNGETITDNKYKRAD